jgi:Protein of unknown function (DUF3732)
LAEAKSADDEDYSRARMLLDEAKRVGLADRAAEPGSRAEAIAMLDAAARQVDVDDDLIVADPSDDLANLQEERRQLRMQLASLKDEMREAELLLSGASGFEREAGEQQARLSAIGLVDDDPNHDEHSLVCPVCHSRLEEPPPAVGEVRQLLEDIADQLAAVHREHPRVQERLARLEKRRSDVEERLRENQRVTKARIDESERLRAQQDAFVQRARILGRIAFYLETAETAVGSDGLAEEIERLRAEVEDLERGLDPEMVEERVATALNVIGQYMTEYAKDLQIEHGQNHIRLDRKNLSVVADTLEGPIPLTRMGSAENWIGYHVVAHLGLHKLFRSRLRPVPGFFMLDQPSQAHYPPERDAEGDLGVLQDEDQAAVRRLFELLWRFATELAPKMQIIVVDHVDIKEPWFEGSVAERWRGGRKLVPDEWREA